MTEFFQGATIGRTRAFSVLGISILLIFCSEGEQTPESSLGAQQASESEPPEVVSDSSATGDKILTGKKIFSADNEELIVRHFFNDRRDGVFLDVGCYHWYTASVTAYLEKLLGWSGVAVDALPHYAAGWKKHRPQSKFYQYAVTDASGEEVTFYVAGPLSSLNEGHVDQFKRLKNQIEKQEITVPTITLNDLLEQHGIEKIDFMNMDIEGSEPAALAGFDIAKYRPDLVCIEVAPNVREKLIEYFDANNYERIDEYLEHDTVNWYYQPRP